METILLPLIAVLAGVVSFSSPCCLPLIPGYLSYVSALPLSQLGERDAVISARLGSRSRHDQELERFRESLISISARKMCDLHRPESLE